MDRLVCGDVGFGKTEVAVRAAFAVAVNGRQALMLAPTTILAEQHWNTFRERFRDFPVRVEMVSRFRKPAEAKAVLRDFAEGKVDVLIGTHRVLSRDVIPKELGLVILDEEQRFGVAQKELLQVAAARGRRAHALGDADPAHAAHVALRPARHLDHRDAARGAPPDPHARRRVRRGARQARARARARARRPGVLPAQPRRDDRRGARRSCGSSAPACASSSRTARCASASSRSRCTPSCAATPTCSSRPRSSSRASTSRRRTR